MKIEKEKFDLGDMVALERIEKVNGKNYVSRYDGRIVTKRIIKTTNKKFYIIYGIAREINMATTWGGPNIWALKEDIRLIKKCINA